MADESTSDDAEELLTPSQIARLFRVAPKTVTRWADQGVLSDGGSVVGGPAREAYALREAARGNGRDTARHFERTQTDDYTR